MKKLFFFFAFAFLAFTSFAQSPGCIISGPHQITVGVPATYTLNISAQCALCYDWDVTGPVTITSSNDQGSTVTIVGTSAGTFTLCVTVFTEDGCITCCLSGTCSPGCCVPEMDGDFSCISPAGHGHVAIEFPSDNLHVCPSSVSSVDWYVNNGTLYGGTGWLIRDLKSTACVGSFIHVRAIIYYNNGCPPDTLNIYIPGACPCEGERDTKGKVNLSTNINGSQLFVNATPDEEMEDVTITVVDLQTGTTLAVAQYERLALAGNESRFQLDEQYKNRLLTIVFTSKGKVFAKNSVFY